MLHIKPNTWFLLAKMSSTGIMCENPHAQIRSYVHKMSIPILTQKQVFPYVLSIRECV